jgi:hypothetical protein
MDKIEWVRAEWHPRGIFFLRGTRPKEIVEEVEGSSYQFNDGTLSMKIPKGAKSEDEYIVFIADVKDPSSSWRKLSKRYVG